MFVRVWLERTNEARRKSNTEIQTKTKANAINLFAIIRSVSQPASQSAAARLEVAIVA